MSLPRKKLPIMWAYGLPWFVAPPWADGDMDRDVMLGCPIFDEDGWQHVAGYHVAARFVAAPK